MTSVPAPPPAKKKKSSAPWIVGLIAIVACMCLIPAGFLATRLRPYWDFGDAANNLDQDVIKAKAAGVPLVAADIAPSPPVPDNRNAAPIIEQAIAEYRKLPGTEHFYEETLSASANGDRAQVKTNLAKASAALTLAAQAAKMPGCDFHRDWDRGPDLLLPEYGYFKRFVHLLALRAQEEAASGDHKSAIADLGHALALGKDAGSEPTLISLLVNLACDQIVADAAERCMADAKNPQDIKAYEEFLAKNRPTYDCSRSLKGEAFMGVTVCRNLDLFSVQGLRALSEGDPQQKPVDPSKLRRSGMPVDRKQRAFMARHLELWTSIFNDTKSLRNNPGAMFARVDSEALKVSSQPGLSYAIEKIIAPVYASAGKAVVDSEARWTIESALAKVLAFHAANGTYPPTLAQAGVTALDPFNGKPLGYIHSAKEVRVYSVGRDGKDNGGRRREEMPKAKALGEGDDVASFPPKPLGPSLPVRKVYKSAGRHP